MPTKGHPGTSPTRRARGSMRGGATHTIRIGYGHPDRPFAVRHLVLEQLSNQAAAMGFLVVTDTVYLKALLPKTPHTLVEATDHRDLEGVWVRMESPAVEGFGHATGTLDSDPLPSRGAPPATRLLCARRQITASRLSWV